MADPTVGDVFNQAALCQHPYLEAPDLRDSSELPDLSRNSLPWADELAEGSFVSADAARVMGPERDEGPNSPGACGATNRKFPPQAIANELHHRLSGALGGRTA